MYLRKNHPTYVLFAKVYIEVSVFYTLVKSRWGFISLIEIRLQTCSAMLFISNKCISFTKIIYILQKYKINSMRTDTFQICKKKYLEKKKYIIFTHGSKKRWKSTLHCDMSNNYSVKYLHVF